MKMMICPRCWGAKIYKTSPCDYCKAKGICEDVSFTKNFSLGELLHSETAIRLGIDNSPTTAQVGSLKLLSITILQPLRDEFGPMHINSGLRVYELNRAITRTEANPEGNTSSAHCFGCAGDATPISAGVTRKDIIDYLVSSDIEFDQAIHEGTWAHVAIKKPDRIAPRKEALMMFGNKYYPYDPNDPRVKL